MFGSIGLQRLAKRLEPERPAFPVVLAYCPPACPTKPTHIGIAPAMALNRLELPSYAQEFVMSLKTLCREYKAVGLRLLMGVVSVLGPAMPAGAESLRAEIVTQLGHTKSVTSVAFSPDGRTVLTGRAGPVAFIPAKPTHVVIAATSVRETADSKSSILNELSPHSKVRIVETSNG